MIDMRLAPWKFHAACSQADPDAWFPDHDGDSTVPGLWEINSDGRAITAKQVCHRCPVKAECLQEALDRREQHGIWGGLTTRERQQLMRRAKR